MKSLFLIILSFNFFATSKIFSQAVVLNGNNKVTRVSTPLLNAKENEHTILLEMGFNQSVSKNKIASIDVQKIESISLVYTKYKLSSEFDQVQLNANRLEKLYAYIPGLINNKNIKWYWIEQTACNNTEDCNNLFHGFVINLKKEDERREAEKSLLDYYVSIYDETEANTETIDSIIKLKHLPFIKVCDTSHINSKNAGNKMAKIYGFNKEVKSKINKKLKRIDKEFSQTSLELIINTSGKFQSLNPLFESEENKKFIQLLNSQMRISPARYAFKKIQTKATVTIVRGQHEAEVLLLQTPILPDNRPFQLDSFLYRTTTKIKCQFIDTSTRTLLYGTSETVVLNAFERNKNWENCLVVTDVTGSMYPYLAQFKVWHNKHLEVNKGNHDFVFFNDGDGRPDHTKVSGSVGGNYYVKTSKREELFKTMNMSMSTGGGGDTPENNIEAVLEGLKMNNKLKAVIMIADNYATPRDLDLISKVKIPIRLIVCGAQNGINTAYLEMVRKNKGSIHTMEDDLFNLFEYKEGDTFLLDGLYYQIVDGVIKNLTSYKMR